MQIAARHLRLPAAGLAAAVVACGLFLLMHGLISAGDGQRSEPEVISRIRFGKVEIPDDTVEQSRRRLPRPPPVNEPPKRPKLQPARFLQPVRDLPRPDLPALDVPLVAGNGLYLGNFQPAQQQVEGDVIPVLVIRPMYPREAAIAGIEGWVRIEFTITETGAVKDPAIVDAEPPGIFNREAMRALLKWKFKPRVVDGVAVERRATQVIDFSLDAPER
jgi:protein TonB